MSRKNSIVLLIIIAIFATTLWVILPLRSSVELTFQAQFSANITAAEKATIIDEGVLALEQRIKNQGIRNYEIIRQGDDSLQVVLSDYADIARAKTSLGQIGNFGLVASALNGEKLGRNLQLGLDLAGGVKLQYEAIFTENVTDQQAAMDRTMLTISKRIDQFGVTEPTILQMGSTGILIELPGFTDFDAAKSLVEQVILNSARSRKIVPVRRSFSGTILPIMLPASSTPWRPLTGFL